MTANNTRGRLKYITITLKTDEISQGLTAQ